MMVSEKTLILRADGGETIGTGHIMRCLALAQAWQDLGGQAVLITAHDIGDLMPRLLMERLAIQVLPMRPGSLEDAALVGALARRRQADWVVVDGYQFSDVYQRALREQGVRVLALDDYGHTTDWQAHLILNQNSHAHHGSYPNRAPHTDLLLGLRYLLLRREFQPHRRERRQLEHPGHTVLVTLGGADPDGVTCRVLEGLALMRVLGMEIVVVVGATNPHRDTIRNFAYALGARVETNTPQMASLMQQTDLAVAAGGTTSWELAFMGVPSALVVLADNQREVANGLARAGAAINLGWHAHLSPKRIATEITALLADPGRRAIMSQQGQALIDGDGGRRIIQCLLARQLVRVRPACPLDCERVWQWANDPAVRAASFSSTPIPWASHVQWFADRLASDHCQYFIATDEAGNPLGQVRFDQVGDSATVSVALSPTCRGKGLAWAVLWSAAEAAFQAEPSLLQLHAYIKDSNQSSLRAFLRAGYHRVGRTTVSNHVADHLTLYRHARQVPVALAS